MVRASSVARNRKGRTVGTNGSSAPPSRNQRSNLPELLIQSKSGHTNRSEGIRGRRMSKTRDAASNGITNGISSCRDRTSQQRQRPDALVPPRNPETGDPFYGVFAQFPFQQADVFSYPKPEHKMHTALQLISQLPSRSRPKSTVHELKVGTPGCPVELVSHPVWTVTNSDMGRECRMRSIEVLTRLDTADRMGGQCSDTDTTTSDADTTDSG
ncbi:Prokaryotic membrane lipoprotein lipid attachment site [Carpediemonas membranifera]|uniref:Prokaryotic membrane lipoprotein lipid attachment site n=1 Tax=Carpediemonas membranifera TaxID=201153 RepID=A0A8J6E675_9EUKA|nr:Prokaryotic membrane lipoprotein lipid attachment site [Carpediemonas membranifera]|eukprot:KAG9396757.1 Prokaryotic membrane lipoprotein lipid attachment site [Carpediemonas membranifera]